MKTGRPSKLTDELWDKAVEIARSGATEDEVIADALGVSCNTLRNWVRKNVRFAGDLAEAKREGISLKYVDAIQLKLALANRWIEDVLSGNATQKKVKCDGKGNPISIEYTSIVPDRWLLSRILGEVPSHAGDFNLNISIADPDDEEP